AEPGGHPTAVALAKRNGASDSGLDFEVPENAATLRVKREQVALGISEIKTPVDDHRLRSPRRRSRKTERPLQFHIRNIACAHAGSSRRHERTRCSESELEE